MEGGDLEYDGLGTCRSFIESALVISLPKCMEGLVGLKS